MEKPWRKYVEDNYHLYYVDYRDDLSEHKDIMQKCLEDNNLYPLSEVAYDWWMFPEEYELSEIEKEMAADGLQGEFDDCRDEIIEWMQDHDTSDPVKDLLDNTSATVMYYAIDLDLDHGHRTAFLCNPWQNESNKMAAYKVRRCLGIKKGTKEGDLIDEIVNGSYGGGELRLYFRDDIRNFISGDEYASKNDKADFTTIHFSGKVAVAIYNPTEGSGWYEMINIDRDIPFIRENLRISALDRYSLESCFGVYDSFCDGKHEIYASTQKPKHKLKTKVSQTVAQEKHFEEVFKAGGCSYEDSNMSRHRDVQYINQVPCRWECPHCGREWLD